MNKLIIIGNVTRDPAVHTTKTGKTVCSFTIAVNGRKRADGSQDVTFFNANAWQKTAELCTKYVAKGRKVCIEGPVSYSTYTGKDGKERVNLDVLVSNIEFLSGAERNENNAQAETTSNVQEVPEPVSVPDYDLPF